MEHITKRTPSEYEVLWEQEIRTTINTGCSTATSSFIMTIDSILHVCQFAKHVIMYVELRFYVFSFFFFKKNYLQEHTFTRIRTYAASASYDDG